MSDGHLEFGWWRVHLHYYAAGGGYYATTIDVRANSEPAAIAAVEARHDTTLDLRDAFARPISFPTRIRFLSGRQVL